jgi:hypothetical protein
MKPVRLVFSLNFQPSDEESLGKVLEEFSEVAFYLERKLSHMPHLGIVGLPKIGVEVV